MRTVNLYILVLLLLLTPGTLLAEDDAGTETVFSIGAGARAMGMGNGFVGLADDASAVYYNPAGMLSLQSQQITFLHTILFEETVYDFLSYVRPFNRGAFGIAGMRIGTSDIGRRDNEYYDLGRFSASRMQFIASYGHRISDRFAVGVSGKMAHHSIDTYSAYGFGLDISGRVSITERLSAGVLLQDMVGPKMQLINEKERTPFTLKTGLAYRLGDEFSPIRANIVFDVDKPENRNAKIRTGVEATHTSGLTLRTGYDRDNLTLGLGIRYQDLNFDYAYKFMEYLDDSHRFSFTFDFGLSQEEKLARQREAAQLRQEKLLADQRHKALLAELNTADRYYEAGKYDSALAAYYRADAYADDKGYITARINNILGMMGGTQQSQQPAIIIDSSGALAGLDFMHQSRILYQQGSLIAARDMIEMARKFGADAPELDSLDLKVNLAIDEVISENISKAKQAFDRGNYIAAYNHYNTVLVYNTSNALARKGSELSEKRLSLAQHLNLGLEYYNQGKYISAQRAFNRALSLEPDNETAREYLGKITSRIKESVSLEDLQKNERVWQLYLEGLEAFRRGEYEKSIDLWEDVLEVYPNNKNTLENIDQARLRLKK